MLSRFSSLRFVAANVSKLAATRTTTPVASNPLLHTSAARNDTPKRPAEIKKPVTTESDMKKIDRIMDADYNPNVPERYVAVALAGCGRYDGTYPLEAMSLAISLQRHNFTAHFYAGQYAVPSIDHLTGRPFLVTELREAPRWAWSDAARLIDENSIYDLSDLANPENCRQYCGLFIPGGQGIGLKEFRHRVEEAVYRYSAANKPIATVSNGSILVTPILSGVRVTMGATRKERARVRSPHLDHKFGEYAIIESASSLEVVHCDRYNVFSTPGHYGCGATLWDVHRGIERLVKAVKADIDERETPAGW
uniref:DJ-1/PfpI domain-containing protein n=1 Tax=Trichogramma kaykai TaxID=54128 RepID=A0ABD2XJZ3_9HYME